MRGSELPKFGLCGSLGLQGGVRFGRRGNVKRIIGHQGGCHDRVECRRWLAPGREDKWQKKEMGKLGLETIVKQKQRLTRACRTAAQRVVDDRKKI